MFTDFSDDHPDVYSVSELNNQVKDVLEDTFPQVWVEGEISNFAAPGSGHWYFSLKDAQAQVRCAMFRGNQRRLTFTPKDGLHILIRARVSMYPNRGEYQLIVDHMEERGEGKLRRAFELLKKKLEAEGLFAPEHKKDFPAYPQCIGVITSPTGAAIRDILNVLKRRYPCAEVVIYPTLVQGTTAAPAIVEAIKTANKRKECDALILARGGGSLEDLWPFNEEMVARAIYANKIPLISGIGHEVDFTIADFVADRRAPTPSAAAEILTPDADELLQQLKLQKQQLCRRILALLNSNKQQLVWQQRHLAQQHPKRRLLEKMQRLDFCELALTKIQHQLLSKLQHQAQQLEAQLQRLTPKYRIDQLIQQINQQQQVLISSVSKRLAAYQADLANKAGRMHALSPLATLKRGYAIVQNGNQQVILNSSNTHPGDTLNIKLSEGRLTCRVEQVINE